MQFLRSTCDCSDHIQMLCVGLAWCTCDLQGWLTSCVRIRCSSGLWQVIIHELPASLDFPRYLRRVSAAEHVYVHTPAARVSDAATSFTALRQHQSGLCWERGVVCSSCRSVRELAQALPGNQWHSQETQRLSMDPYKVCRLARLFSPISHSILAVHGRNTVSSPDVATVKLPKPLRFPGLRLPLFCLQSCCFMSYTWAWQLSCALTQDCAVWQQRAALQ